MKPLDHAGKCAAKNSGGAKIKGGIPMQYRKDRKGNELSILGYGCMRFTRKGSGLDIDKAERELMAAYRAGVNYYDTAYIYPGSEEALGNFMQAYDCATG